MKVIALILAASLISTPALSATTSTDTLTTPTVEAVPQTPASDVGNKGEYSPERENVYLGTAIGTMLVGGLVLALGLSGSDCVGCSMYEDVAVGVGGATLAASTVLWLLYFNEKGKASNTSVGFNLDKGGSFVTVQHRF